MDHLEKVQFSGVSIVCESLLSTSFSMGFSLVGVESFKSYWMLSSMTSPLCNEFLAGAKSLTDTVDSRPLVNLMCAYWGLLRVILLRQLVVCTYRLGHDNTKEQTRNTDKNSQMCSNR